MIHQPVAAIDGRMLMHWGFSLHMAFCPGGSRSIYNGSHSISSACWAHFYFHCILAAGDNHGDTWGPSRTEPAPVVSRAVLTSHWSECLYTCVTRWGWRSQKMNTSCCRFTLKALQPQTTGGVLSQGTECQLRYRRWSYFLKWTPCLLLLLDT